MLIAGGLTFLFGLVILCFVVSYWSNHYFNAIGNVLPAVAGTTLMVVGAQNALGGFLLAIVNGNETTFVTQPPNQLAASQNDIPHTQKDASCAAAG
jgi:Na+/melibiose symporter-like transporter